MIGAGAIGGGAIVRPFFNRGGSAPPPAITRTAIGTVAQTASPTLTTINTPIIPGDALVLVGITYDNAAMVGSIQPDFTGSPRGNWVPDNGAPVGALDQIIQMWSVDLLGVPVNNKPIEWNWITSPVNVAAVAIYVSGLTSKAADVQSNGAGLGTDQDSTPTGAPAQAAELFWGIIGTNGRSIDAVGAWQDGFTAGQAVGTASPGALIKEGYFIAAAIAAHQARVTGATSRSWGALVQSYMQ